MELEGIWDRQLDLDMHMLYAHQKIAKLELITMTKCDEKRS